MTTRTRKYAAPIVIAGTVLLFAGCGGGEPETPSQTEQSTATPSESGQSTAAASEAEDTLGAPMHDALDKAEAVEDEVMEQKKAVDEALDAAEDEGT